MAEIKETLKILKARWPESIFIICILNILNPTLYLNPILKKLTLSQDPLCLSIRVFLYSSCSLIFLTIFIPVISGFLKTVYLNNKKRRNPIYLFNIGKHFFFRIFSLFILFFVIHNLLTALKFHLVGSFAISKNIHYFICLSYDILSMIVFVKLILFMPSLIIVFDCSLIKSFKLLKKIKLLKAKELLLPFLIFSTLPTLFPIRVAAPIIQKYFVRLSFFITSTLIGLIMITAAVLFVASLDLVYDNQQINSGFQKLR